MKKLVLASMICAMATTAALGQGTVNFSNLSTALSSPPDRLVRFGNGTGGGPPPVAIGTPASTNLFPGLVAQLYYGASTASEGSLVAVSTAPGTLRASTSASVGTWFGNGSRTLTGFNAGDTVNLQVRVWDARGAFVNGFDPATADLNAYAQLTTFFLGNYAGRSAIFQYTIPTSATPAPAEFNMNNFQSFQLTFYWAPEPSTFTLSGLGAAAFVIFRRRKCRGA